MKKYEYELQIQFLKTRRVELFFAVVKTAVVCATVLIAISLIVKGVAPFLDHDAGRIEALAKVIESFHLGSILGWLIGGVFGVAWGVERHGKQRAIKEKAHYQALVEKNDLNRDSSGLTEIGHTP